MIQFAEIQDIHDFALEWKNNQRTNRSKVEMGFYKETWAKMQVFTGIIERVPMQPIRFRTIQLETITEKKLLEEIPKKIVESIKHNVTKTIETEARVLKDELAKTSEVLEQMPTSLNVYVE